MTERPILFSAPMVRAILSGAKTQTRRVVKTRQDAAAITPQQQEGRFLVELWPKQEREMGNFGRCHEIKCPYGVVGDRLWVKETWRVHRDYNGLSPTKVGIALGGDYAHCIDYLADPDTRMPDIWGKTRVSIHMPRWASRISLEIVDVRAERLQAISDSDAKAEGVEHAPGTYEGQKFYKNYGMENFLGYFTAQLSYRTLWEKINGPGSWALNPFVWVLTFKRVTG